MIQMVHPDDEIIRTDFLTKSNFRILKSALKHAYQKVLDPEHRTQFIPDPDPDFLPIPDPGSRGSKRHRIPDPDLRH